MSRPLRHYSETLLREEHIRLTDRLARLNDAAHHLATQLEQRDTGCKSAILPDITALFASINYEKITLAATAEARAKLEEELEAIAYEMEERESDARDVMDASGGIAA